MRRTHDGFMKCGSSKNLVYSLNRTDIDFLHAHAQMAGLGELREGGGINPRLIF